MVITCAVAGQIFILPILLSLLPHNGSFITAHKDRFLSTEGELSPALVFRVFRVFHGKLAEQENMDVPAGRNRKQVQLQQIGITAVP